MVAAAMVTDLAAIRDLRLAEALRQVEELGVANLRKLRSGNFHRGEPEPIRRRKHARMGYERARRLDPLAVTGAQWFYARWCALQCLHLWPAPDLVRLYLDTGDPKLASLRENEAAGGRDTAYGLCSRYTKFQLHILATAAAENAAWAALWATTGNFSGAAECAIKALAFAAKDAAEKTAGGFSGAEEHLAVFNAARSRLEVVFAASAKEIFEGEWVA